MVERWCRNIIRKEKETKNNLYRTEKGVMSYHKGNKVNHLEQEIKDLTEDMYENLELMEVIRISPKIAKARNKSLKILHMYSRL